MDREGLLQQIVDAGFENVDRLVAGAGNLSREDLLWVANRVLEQTGSQELFTTISSAGYRADEREHSDYVQTQEDQKALDIATQARDQALAAGATEPEANRMGNAAAGSDVLGTITAEEGAFIEMFGGTVAVANERLQEINDTYGLDYESISEFVQGEEWKNATYRQNFEQLFGGPEPEQAMEFYSGSQKVSVTIPTLAKAQEAFNLNSAEDVGKFVRLANANGMTTVNGQVAWQPMAALMTWVGFDSQKDNQRVQTDSALLREEARLKQKIADIEERAGSGGAPRSGQAVSDLQRRLGEIRSQLQERATDISRTTTPRFLADLYREGQRLYGGSDMMAFFHVVDSGLAAKIAESPDLMEYEDVAAALGHLQQAGIQGATLESFAENMFDLGFTDPMAMELTKAMQKQAAAGGGGGGRIRVMPDPAAVRQSAKDFYRQLFLEDPDEATLDQFAGQVSAAITSAADDQNIDPNAQIRKAAEALPKYQELYGNKPSGMSEQDYAGMFMAAQSSMLGQETAGDVAARVGMKSGQYQTAVGATMGTKQAWDNSTFMGRLAQAAETVNRNT